MSLTPEQIELRRSGIASSDVPAICNLYPGTWKNRRGPDDVLREKLGSESWEGSARTRRGDWLEPVIAEKWALDTGRPIERSPGTVRHPTIPWALATPDFVVAGPPRELLEIKLVGPYALKSWEAGPPTYVQAQIQWQLGCLGLARANVAALIEGDRDFPGPRTFAVEFRQETFDDLLTLCGLFWDRVTEARNSAKDQP